MSTKRDKIAKIYGITSKETKRSCLEFLKAAKFAVVEDEVPIRTFPADPAVRTRDKWCINCRCAAVTWVPGDRPGCRLWQGQWKRSLSAQPPPLPPGTLSVPAAPLRQSLLLFNYFNHHYLCGYCRLIDRSVCATCSPNRSSRALMRTMSGVCCRQSSKCIRRPG